MVMRLSTPNIIPNFQQHLTPFRNFFNTRIALFSKNMMDSFQKSNVSFPANFVWGAGTSAYQVEGAATPQDRGQNVWDSFCRQPGAVQFADSGDQACDHVHRFREDVALMRQIGLRAYRFSISWARVLPHGVGAPNEAGVSFYDALVDELLAADIEPWITLFHWDYPQALYDRGGWLHSESSSWFADYTRVVVERLSDRVQHWITINEPQCFVCFGHGDGTNAPGVKLSIAEQLTAVHNTLLAHGRAVTVIREVAKTPPQIGWAPVAVTSSPASDKSTDIEAARQATMEISSETLWNNIWYNDPLFFGNYPESGLRIFGDDVPKFSQSDRDCIAQPIDFLGLNIYTATRVEASDTGEPSEIPFSPGAPRSAFDWPVVDDCLHWGALFHAERYQVPIVITENGMANIDWVSQDGCVHDPQRIDYTRRHLLSLSEAIADGVDVRGYFHWSIMDNFEWAEGFNKRFGLIHVDFESQERTLKDSAHWYQKVIETNGGCLRED